jgi:phosphoenolpyruvate carboxykinase (GTP)
MLPFMGYNMSDYFQHWLDLGEKVELLNWCHSIAKNLHHQLVPQGRRRQVRLARLRREHARAEVDDRSHRRHAHKGQQHRLRRQLLSLRRNSTGPAWISAPSPIRQTVTNIDKAAWQAELQLHADLFQQLAYHLPAELQETKAPHRDTSGCLKQG